MSEQDAPNQQAPANGSPETAPAPLPVGAGAYPPYPASSDEEDENRLREYYWIIRKRLWTLPLMVLSCLAVALFYSWGERPVYTAHGQILINPLGSVAAGTGVTPLRVTMDMATQVVILKGTELARRVIDKLKLHYDPDFLPDLARAPGDSAATGAQTAWPRAAASPEASPLLPRERLVARVLSGLAVAQVGNSAIVQISYTAPTPKLAADITNCILETVVDMEMDRNVRSAQKAIDWLRDQQTDFRAKLKTDQRELQGLEKELDIVTLGRDERARAQDLLSEQVISLGKALIEAHNESIRLSIRCEGLTETLRSGKPLQLIAEVRQSEAVQALMQERTALQRQESALAGKAGPKNPELRKLQGRLARLKADLDTEVRNVVESLTTSYETAKRQERLLQDELNKVRARVAQLNEKTWRYKLLKRDAAMNAQLFDSLLEKAKEAGLAGELTGSNIQVISRAAPPDAPSRTGRTRRMGLAVVLGVFLGGMLAFVLDHLDRSVKGIGDVERLLGVPVLAAVNQFPGKRRSPPSLVVTDKPKSSCAEAFRTLRMRLAVGRRLDKFILVTSAGPSEGKTTISSNLAVAMAEAGGRVLLIDADVRKPAISKVFGLSGEADLVSHLQGRATLEEAIQATAVKNLDVIPTLKPLAAAEISELIEGPRLSKMFHQLRERYDLVILDSAPIGAVGEPLLLASLAKSVLLVVRAGYTARGLVQRAVEHLSEADGSTVGVVVNFADTDRRGYYYDYYYYRRYYGGPYGYGYGADREEAQDKA